MYILRSMSVISGSSLHPGFIIVRFDCSTCQLGLIICFVLSEAKFLRLDPKLTLELTYERVAPVAEDLMLEGRDLMNDWSYWLFL